MSNFLTVLLVLLVLVGVIGLGFVIPPRPFRSHPRPTIPNPPRPVRTDLPEPVERHFRETLGDAPQTINSAVVWGRGRACIRGLWVPLRFKAWYRPGAAFSRRVEITWYMRPVLRGIDQYINGQGVSELGGRVETGEQIDQGQLLALWAEAVWTPTIFVHDPAVRWEPVDDLTARLVVPAARATGVAGTTGGGATKRGIGATGGATTRGIGPAGVGTTGVGATQRDIGAEESLLVHFDEQTGRMTHLSTIRFSSAAGGKEPWRVDLLDWGRFGGILIPNQISVAWGESGSPWSYWTVDGVAYNVNVSDQLDRPPERKKG